mgnify:CR=1 FL=1
MNKLRKSFFYALTIGFLICSSIQKTYAYPSLFYSSGSGRRVNKTTCIMESYGVLANFRFYPVQDIQRKANSVFAMARNSDTQIIVLCEDVSNDGSITVIAASDKGIGMSLTENILEQIKERLRSY